MKKIDESFKQFHIDAPETWDSIISKFDAQMMKGKDEITLFFDDERLTGKLKYLCYNYLQYYEYDFTFSEEVVLQLCSDEGEFYFVYCWEGKLEFYLKDSPVNECLSFQPGIFPCPQNGNVSVVFEKDSRTRFTIIKLIKHDLAHSPYERNMYDTFELLKEMEKQPNPFYFGNFNLKIAESIEQLNALDASDISQKYFREGMLHIILGYHIQQFYSDKDEDKFSCSSLTKEESLAIKETAAYICSHLELPHTIETLCRRSGLYACKLQEGFKTFYNRTVVDFIRNERLREAESLIKNSDYNISQIVYSVGFTSRSYFSKIFKEKYNCSPKFYQKMARTGNVASE